MKFEFPVYRSNVSLPLLQLLLYPNPNQGTFRINYLSSNSEFHIVQIAILNIIGQTLQTDVVEVDNGILNQQLQLPSEISTGIYFVRMIDGNTKMEKKFIIQR